ncbi:MAG: outer membrane lipoprotein-sorting protein, partial [Prosthecobacter sp.]|nr:outer membrane lipoprotein-sorting protein [Prosthecobacter sp.]
LALSANAADTASELAAKLSVAQQDGSSLVRLKMEARGVTLQLQIKQRRSASATEVVYQILWPKERLGESVLLKKIGNQTATGTLFVPPATVRQLDMKDALFGSDVSYADVLENFFAWPNQAIVGTEVVNRVSCQILESKPGKGQRSNYAAVRTWVDARHLVPLRIEKYNAAGQVMRRIESGRIVTDDIGRHVPTGLTVSDPTKGSSTELDGSKLKHDVTFTKDEFTPEGLKQVITPRSSSE